VEGDSIGSFEDKKSFYEHVSNSKWLLRLSCLNQQIPNHLVLKKVKFLLFILILIQCLNDKFVTVHNKCSQIPPPPLTHFATHERKSLVVRLS
jgi:hypothetical protein